MGKEFEGLKKSEINDLEKRLDEIDEAFVEASDKLPIINPEDKATFQTLKDIINDLSSLLKTIKQEKK